MAAVTPSPLLVIHHDSSTRLHLVKTLRGAGFVVLEASDALDVVAQQDADILLAVLPLHPDDMEAQRLSLTLRQQHPGLRIIAVGDGEGWADCSLEQPVQAAQLLLAVRLLLREQAAPAAMPPTAQAHASTLTTIAHDLRNALAPLRSAIAIMTRMGGGDEQSRKPVLAMMEKQVGQMVGLIDNLSDATRRFEGKSGAMGVDTATPAPTGAAPAARAPAHGQGRRVLVADDSAAVQDSVSALLRSQGYDVRTASDGLEALETASSWLPDFVLVDMRMPRLDGFGLARRLRADFPQRAMKIILMSGISLDSVLIRHARAAGFDVCIDKVSPPEQWFVHLHSS